MLENFKRELDASAQAHTLAIWNLILSGITMAGVLFAPQDRIGVGIGVAIIMLWNFAFVYDRKIRLRKAAKEDDVADKEKV
ncbi:MAG: hypothetical protein WCP68_15885 [Enhydrobacter sp.]